LEKYFGIVAHLAYYVDCVVGQRIEYYKLIINYVLGIIVVVLQFLERVVYYYIVLSIIEFEQIKV